MTARAPSVPARVLAVYHRGTTFGGSFNSVLDVLARLDRARFAVTVGLPGRGNVQEAFERLDVPVRTLAEVAASRTPAYAAATVRAWNALRRERAALVYVTDYVTWRSSVLTAARLTGVPRVVHVRAPLSPQVLDPELVRATMVIGNSEASIRALRDHRPDDRVRVVHNFIDFTGFDAAVDIRHQFFAGDAPIVGFVGVFRPEKGIEYFLQMARVLLDRGRDVRFLAVGGESAVQDIGWFATMRAMAAELGLGDRICFTGSRADIPDVMKSIDVLVVPSLNEGFGRVIVEANAVGVPAVGADAAGIPEVIENGVTGFLVPPRDAGAMADLVGRLIDDSALRERMRQTLPGRVRQRFHPDVQMALLADAFDEALDRGRP